MISDEENAEYAARWFLADRSTVGGYIVTDEDYVQVQTIMQESPNWQHALRAIEEHFHEHIAPRSNGAAHVGA